MHVVTVSRLYQIKKVILLKLVVLVHLLILERATQLKKLEQLKNSIRNIILTKKLIKLLTLVSSFSLFICQKYEIYLEIMYAGDKEVDDAGKMVAALKNVDGKRVWSFYSMNII